MHEFCLGDSFMVNFLNPLMHSVEYFIHVISPFFFYIGYTEMHYETLHGGLMTIRKPDFLFEARFFI